MSNLLADMKNAILERLHKRRGPHDTARVRGNLVIEVRGPDGAIKETRTVPNLVVTVGLQHIADQMSDQGEGAMSHMAIGAGVAAAAAGDTALGSELGRVALTSTTQSTVSVVYIATFPAGTGTGAVTEAGIFNATPAGVMLCRTVFAVVNKAAADSITITWTLTFSAA